MISIIIVSWNVAELLKQCLQSIFTCDFQHVLQVIVFDNNSSDGTVAMVEELFPYIQLIAHHENIGFARGNNQAIRHAKGDFIFLLNPDTRLESDTLTKLFTYLKNHPKVGVVGPKLVYPDGSIQSSRRRFPTIGSLFFESTLLETWFPNSNIVRYYRFADVSDTEITAVDWLVGAALFIRRTAWETVGGLDESFFMYFEEADWCRRCKQADWAIHYLPHATVIHYEGESSKQVITNRIIRFQQSKIRYTEKWFGRKWAWLVQLFLLVTIILEWKIEFMKWFVGHKRPLRFARMKTYGEVLKAGLNKPVRR